MRGTVFKINGIVQGVGFRPFVKRLADSMSLAGSVINTTDGVEIRLGAVGREADLFIDRLKSNLPPLAHILYVDSEAISGKFPYPFVIEASRQGLGVTMVSPDIALCHQCRAEIETAEERRFGYPFTNCTNCGPRYSIMESLPYDRPNTVMKAFEMCSDCLKEYENPSDRRFHAQPIACGKCGPQVYLNIGGKTVTEPNIALKTAAEEINKGNIIAMKGLGGYHLLCNAYNDSAVKKLRTLKNRMEKPLAVMCRNIDVLEKYITINHKYKSLITSPQAPIVIFPWKGNPLSPLINPLSDKIGVMIAYTPLHVLMFDYLKCDFIVATSGNLRDEPIAKDSEEAERNLGVFTDVFLHHSRHIHNRLDDSVATVTHDGYTLLRRSRGFAPFPVIVKARKETTAFAAGANLKNGMAFYKNGNAFLSQYIGDLDSAENIDFYNETYKVMESLFQCKPQVVIKDLHPQYTSSKFADNLGVETAAVQHHAAHFASCLAENSHYGNAVGVILDGFGLGADSEAWGGEFFVKMGSNISRVAHLKKFPQPGMDSAAKHPARMLVSYLWGCGLLEKALPLLKKRVAIDENEALLISNMCYKMINSVYTTSAGRLFEAVGSLLACKKSNEYEGALAVALESMIDPSETACYNFAFSAGVIEPQKVFEEILQDIQSGVAESVISAKFHNGFAKCVAETAASVADNYGADCVALSGGVFQNITLLDKISHILKSKGLRVMTHTKVPANDGGIALGQLYFYLQDLKLL